MQQTIVDVALWLTVSFSDSMHSRALVVGQVWRLQHNTAHLPVWAAIPPMNMLALFAHMSDGKLWRPAARRANPSLQEQNRGHDWRLQQQKGR